MNENKTNINWYPGHMAKTKREIINDLNLIDIVIELLDARIPISSRNPDIYSLTKNKKRIILLNKADLSDAKMNEQWLSFFSKEAPTILTDANSGKGVNKISETIDKLMEEEQQRQQARGLKNKTISAYAKAGSSLRSPPGNSRASTPKTRVCLLSALCFHLHL